MHRVAEIWERVERVAREQRDWLICAECRDRVRRGGRLVVDKNQITMGRSARQPISRVGCPREGTWGKPLFAFLHVYSWRLQRSHFFNLDS